MSIHSQILKELQLLNPFDEKEKNDLQKTCDWVLSHQPIFRIKKPNIPNQHLVSYFMLFDPEENKFLLVNHKKAGLWLPAGGHVEVDEHPKETVKRELLEELGLSAQFLLDSPLFLTVTQTVGERIPHTDVSFWYLLKGDSKKEIVFDQQEFTEVQWYTREEIASLKKEPNMDRFLNKLETIELVHALLN